MRRPNLAGLALVAGLIWRVVRAGRPPPVTTAARLRNIPCQGLPVREPVRIHWDEHQVPGIEAANEPDLAVGLGVVHAHLRLAQMELMRRLATGRVAEVIGRAGIELDHALRLMRLDRAVPGIAAMLLRSTRVWAEGFVAGVNHHIAHAPALPPEFRLLGLTPGPWTLADLLAVGRLAATDVSWLVFARLLHGQARLSGAEWETLWPLMQQGDTLPWPAREAEAVLTLVRGSNSAAVPARRGRDGAGMIASDPHLAITLPPLWLIAGLHAPGLDVVGLMIPGLPVVALGRNRWIAWGGTNLHAASSELVDVAAEPMTVRQEVIRVKGGRPVTLTLRETRFGPVVSDGILLSSRRPLALRWVGHRPSDEMTAMLGVMRARDFAGFRTALEGFAVPGQTMLAVEAGPSGRAGRVIAAHLPRRADAPLAGPVCPPHLAWTLDDLVPGTAFAGVGDIPVVSANDRPEATSVPVGFFFSPPDRVRRLRSLLEAADPVTPEAMRALQQDVRQPAALGLRDALLPRIPPPSPQDAEALRVLAAWDGAYDASSRGALVFEVFVAALAHRLVPAESLALLTAIWSGRALIARRIAQAPPRALGAALHAAARALRRHGTWGAVHRLALRHPLASLPLVGGRYAVPDFAAAGGNDTLNKTGHGLVRGRHRVTFGACARHVSDLADPNANGFVLLGGQDGWLGSANAADQVPLWRAGCYITVPLQPEAARAWPHHTRLLPP
ncbi:Penicillin acylase family protein [Rhodovastum atsumiense]|uniref:Penicillin acylase family protein n=1 Tax=Rhodovastum atsumiense TaxID=504468 RepID=A0A5M6J333_9PROT|nr:penicillin acylase family protein [Rhodovastum atsumiense]KAA5614649.1 penicillin acylase family protein [Rhodovastum atsumiense]CAH2599834.1 Penicillin acylase family protein [Rhodovastum atsumiense]